MLTYADGQYEHRVKELREVERKLREQFINTKRSLRYL
jgi:hypothetical protein